MTKAEIVNEVAKATGIEKATVQIVVESFMESVKGSLAKGNPVYLRGFGSFIIKHRAEKAARNITKNTTMTIPAHNIPAFKPAKVFVNEVAKATGIEKATVQIVVESFMESVKGSLAKGNPVYLRGFGSFIIKHRAEKAARNITKNTTMTIPAHNIPAFKPAKVFVNSIK